MEGLSNKILNSKIPYVGDYVRIVYSFCNVFRPQGEPNHWMVLLVQSGLVPWDVVLMCLLACTIKSNDFFVHIYLIIFAWNWFIQFQIKL